MSAARIQSPIEAWQSAGLFEKGLGVVAVARRESGSRTELAAFLLDVFCLGVRNAFCRTLSSSEYRRFLQRLFGSDSDSPPLSIPPSEARKLVLSAVEYGSRLGFEPHPDYAAASRLLEGADLDDCDKTFRFGREGRPCYIQSAFDLEGGSERILRQLEQRCGVGNFDWVLLSAPGSPPT